MGRIILPPDMPLSLSGSDLLTRRSDLDVTEAPDSDAVVEALGSADDRVVFVCPYASWRDEYASELTEGDWVTATGAGYDPYPLEEFSRLGVPFTNTPGIHGEAMGEHVFGIAFTVSRRLFEYREQQRDGRWNRRTDEQTDFAGDVCCVVGVGNVGEPIAKRADAFDMVVRGVKRDVSGYTGSAHRVYPPAELGRALDGARLIVIAVPLTPRTRHLIDRPAFEAVADDAVVVNVARGGVVNQDDLLWALDNDEIRAAGLDVFETEPLPADSPLWDRERVIVTPHCAATSDKYVDRLLDVFFAQYDRWLNGEPLDNRIA